jgi:predicted PurR-regulated permease PerM
MALSHRERETEGMTARVNEGNSTNGDRSGAWTVRRVALATIITLAISFGFFLLYRFYMIVFLLFVAITLAIAIRPAVDWLRARGLREGVGVLLVYALLLVILCGLALAIGPLLIEQINILVAQLPEYYSQLRLALAASGNRLLEQVVRTLPVVPALPEPVVAEEASPLDAFAPAIRFIRTSSYIVFVTGAIVLLAFYWTLEGELITRRLMLLVPINRREEVRALLAEMGGTIGNYFRGQAILCLLVGTLSLIGYWLIGLPNALGLALVMAIFEAIPMIGPTLGAIPAVLVAFSISPEMVLWVLGVVVVIQVLENNLLVPRVMNESVGVNPIISILGIAAFGALFGLAGAILAIPLAAMLQIVFNRLFFRLPGEDEAATVAQVASGTQRNIASKIRLQTQELVLDVRKSARTVDGDIDGELEPEIEMIEDSIEAIALDLDTLLSKAEQTV